MTTQDYCAAGDLVGVVAVIGVGPAGRPLPDLVAAHVTRVVVDSRRLRPDMFEITFYDPEVRVLDLAGIELGTAITVGATGAGQTSRHELVTGEVTAIEGSYAGDAIHTVVRGYTADHRLQQHQRSRTFTNMTDADIARRVALDAGLRVGRIEPTRTVHDHIGQVNQTDWDFLCGRAAELGCDLGVRDGTFFFGSPLAGPTLPVPLRFPVTLRSFHPRITAAGVAARTEVRVWDPLAAKVISSAADTTQTASTDLAAADPATLAGSFGVSTRRPSPPPRGNPALGDLGPAPSAGHVRTDAPVALGPAVHTAAGEVARGAAEHQGATAAEAVGEAAGDPRLLAGSPVQVSGVASVFRGRWVLSSARHVFDEHGYRTDIEVSGSHQRTLLGLAGGTAQPTRLTGLICGIVSDIADPRRLGRVKVTLPLLSPGYETDWAPIAQPGAGTRSGTVFGHEVGDQVLVGHESGDPRRPYVLGGLVSNHSKHSVGGAPVRTAAAASALIWRGMVSPTGNRIAFHDDLPPGSGASPTASRILLGTAAGDLALTIDKVAGEIALHCAPSTGIGKLRIDCGNAGTVEIAAGPGGTVTVDGGAQLNLKAQASVSIESSGPVSIKGNPIKLN